MHSWDPSHDIASVWLPSDPVHRRPASEPDTGQSEPAHPGVDRLWSDEPDPDQEPPEDQAGALDEDDEPWLFPDDEEPTLGGQRLFLDAVPELPAAALEPIH